ncbi:hypothetical protein PIROE2DRAFT_12452 [Piromyces sp. E2]|nr:hypothetical protein PIROE2DRAFT_12452 [Piromyces sp. E2]|eukprot:OUM61539.1 hypothetical protein PIROE2DRAFT_12452 [Piromyces sp. E2]
MEKIYGIIKKEGIHHIITNGKHYLLTEYDENDVLICMYVIAIDNNDLKSIVELNENFSNNKFKSVFFEKEKGIMYHIYVRNLLTLSRLKKIISITEETKVEFKVSIELLSILLQKNEIKLLKILINHLLFSNSFVLSLLYYYKYKKSLANLKLKNMISKEKEKVDLNQLYNSDYYTLLDYACEKGYETIIKYLVKQGADINKENILGETPLFFACRSQNVNVVKGILENGTNINKENILGETPLFIACEIKSEGIAEYLIDYGAEINKEDNDGETPLFVACEYGNLNESLVKMLVEHGADVNKENEYGRIPLFSAIEYGHENIVQCFIENGADIEKEDEDGYTPLYIACENGKDAIVKQLVEQGASINKANNKNHQTPLIISCIKGYENIVKYLIDHGADVNKENGKKESPLFLSHQLKRESITKLLIEKGAKM